MSPDDIYRVSRYLFPFLSLLAALSALGWLHAENKERRERLRAVPAAGIVGELLVLSGSDELPAQTWFPVEREGVLGSVRSCDLVVPCSGVKARHLDYFWRDGVGLIIRPRSGCKAFVDGFLLDCRSDVLSHPLTHGACLQVGQAVLRLQVRKALDLSFSGASAAAPSAEPDPISAESSRTVPDFPGPFPASPDWAPAAGGVPGPDPRILSAESISPAAPAPYTGASGSFCPPVSVQSAGEPWMYSPDSGAPMPFAEAPGPGSVSGNPPPGYMPECSAPPQQAVPAPPRRRADRWKEDWSE